MITLNGRNVIDIEIDGIDYRDYPDFCDAYICNAVWEDTLKDLTDDELEELNEDSQLIHELVWERIH